MGEPALVIPAAVQPEKDYETSEIHSLIAAGEAVWDDFTFFQRCSRGWLFDQVLMCDAAHFGRWNWWMQCLLDGSTQGKEIPKIQFCADPHTPGFNFKQSGMKMLEKCMDHHSCYAGSARIGEFLDWLMWGLGLASQRPRIDERVYEHWYRTFNLEWFYKAPTDYFGDFISDSRSTKWSNPTAFFPTPMQVCECMMLMTCADGVGIESSVMEPCAGTGRMLLLASNYSVNLFGIEIDHMIHKAAMVNMAIYVPWMISPGYWLEPRAAVRLVRGDALRMGLEGAPKTPPEPPKPPPQLTLFSNSEQEGSKHEGKFAQEDGNRRRSAAQGAPGNGGPVRDRSDGGVQRAPRQGSLFRD